jgi:putative nucleotidyltransferase with HDIG domain
VTSGPTNPAVHFLHTLSQALSASTLYASSHPACQRAVKASYDALRILQSLDDTPSFSFLDRDVVYGFDSLREMRDWEWAVRLGSIGIQRIEIVADVSPEAFEIFIDEMHARLAMPATAAATAAGTGVPDRSRQSAIRYGPIGIQGAIPDGITGTLIAEIPFTLEEEAEAVRYIHAEVTERGTVPMVEAEAVIRSLSVALHADGKLLVPLLRMKAFDQYTTTHSVNVALLSMALAEALGHSPRDIRTIGVAGLLHDLGKVRVPLDILTKPGSLSPEEREILERHPSEGARIILNSDSKLTLPAAVSFEHHIMINGGGYPRRHFARDCHYASTVVHVCDVYDALHTDRPYRAAWPSAKALHYIERRAEREFDPTIANTFIALMRKNERAVFFVDEATPVVLPGTTPPTDASVAPTRPVEASARPATPDAPPTPDVPVVSEAPVEPLRESA